MYVFNLCSFISCTIDTIDSNVESAASRVEAGNEQLIKAAEYQVCQHHSVNTS